MKNDMSSNIKSDVVIKLIPRIKQMIHYGESLSTIHDDLINYHDEETIFFAYIAAKIMTHGQL